LDLLTQVNEKGMLRIVHNTETIFQKAIAVFHRYDTVYASLTDCVSFVVCKTPNIRQKARYVPADISRQPGINSKERGMNLLRKADIACVPCGSFYYNKAGENLTRFYFAKKDAALRQACRSLGSL